MKAAWNKTRTIPTNETVAHNGEMILSVRGKGVYLFEGALSTTGHWVCTFRTGRNPGQISKGGSWSTNETNSDFAADAGNLR